jgi:DUF971 family protein
MNPKQFKIKKKTHLSILWEDNSETLLSLKYMRDECPCASCKGETILLRTYRPPSPKIITPEMYEVKNIEVVGDYAIQITWNDGHNTGIYSWDYLKELEKGQNSNDGNKEQNYDPLI